MTPVDVLRSRLGTMVRTRAARSSAWAVLGQLAGVLVGLGNFLLLARVLGPAEYGLVAGAWALVLASGPLMTLGAERLVIRDVTADGNVRAALGAGLVTSAAGATFGVLLLLGLHSFVLPQVPILLLGGLAVAEIFAGGLTGCLIALSFAVGDARSASISTVLVGLVKLSAVLVFAVGGGGDPVQWALAYAALSLAAAAGQVAWGWHRFGRPTLVGYRFVGRVREGLPYSAGTTAGIVHTSADKVLLVRFGYAEEAGLYAVAYRLASMVSTPVLAVMQAMLPRYFAAGARGGVAASAAFGRRLLPPLAAYGVFAAVVLVGAAVFLPDLLGEEYAESASILMLLAPLPLIRLVQSVTGDALTGAGRQGTRTTCAAIAATMNVALNIALIPPFGLTGVLTALLVTQVLSVVLLRLALRRRLRSSAEVVVDVAAPVTAAAPPKAT